jgi:predicted ATPase
LLLQPTRFQPDTILIDEPELGLHPYALSVLAGLLRQAADRRQLVLSTQSADLVNEFAPEDVVVVSRKDVGSVFERLDPDRLTEWLQDYALGELWKMNILGGRPMS